MVTYGQDLNNDCLADSVRLTVASVHTYEYMTEYIATNKTDNIVLAQAVIYLIDGFETLNVIDCSNFPAELEVIIEENDWASLIAPEGTVDDETTTEETTASSRIVGQDTDTDETTEIDPTDYDYELETFQTVDDILTDIETILDMLEVAINGADFLKYWVLERYYDAGYAFGTATLGTVILLKDIYHKLEEISEYQTTTVAV